MKKKVVATVLASAIGFGVLSASAFAYNNNIQNLIYSGVNKVVAAVNPQVKTALDNNQASINQRVLNDIAAAKDKVVGALDAYKQQVIDWGVGEQEGQYNADKQLFDQDVNAAIEAGKAQIGAAATNEVNSNKAETDATYEAGLNAIIGNPVNAPVHPNPEQ